MNPQLETNDAEIFRVNFSNIFKIILLIVIN